MKNLKYFLQFLIIITFLIIFKILGFKLASNLSGVIMKLIGPFFRSKLLIKSNLLRAIPNLENDEILWKNLSRVYVYK